MEDAKKKKAMKKTNSNIENKKSSKIVKKVNSKKNTKIKKYISKKIKKNAVNKNKQINFKNLNIILILLIIIALISFNLLSNNLNENTILKNSKNFSIVTVTVIEDPNCIICNSNLYLNQIKQGIISNLEIYKINFKSKEGKDIIKKTNSTQLPIYLFSENIQNKTNWNSQLKSKFNFKIINNISVYMLKPKIVPNKMLINELKISNNTIIFGNKSAKLTIYEFSDYRCPYCAIAEGSPKLLLEFKKINPKYQAPMKNIYKDYIQTGKVKLVFYNTPLEQIHPGAKILHIAALCAKEQGISYWKLMNNKLFLNQNYLIGGNINLKLQNYSKEIKLNTNQFNKCLNSKKYNSQINEEIKYAQSLGIFGAPVFFIGNKYIPGAQDYQLFKTIIDRELLKSN